MTPDSDLQRRAAFPQGSGAFDSGANRRTKPFPACDGLRCTRHGPCRTGFQPPTAQRRTFYLQTIHARNSVTLSCLEASLLREPCVACVHAHASRVGRVRGWRARAGRAGELDSSVLTDQRRGQKSPESRTPLVLQPPPTPSPIPALSAALRLHPFGYRRIAQSRPGDRSVRAVTHVSTLRSRVRRS